MQFMAKLYLWELTVGKFSLIPQTHLYIEQNTDQEHELKPLV